MSRNASAPALRHGLLAIFSLAGIHLTAPWPGPQAVINAFLVLGLAPEFRSPFMATLWAAGAGWVLEGSLRQYPHLGGTALANMVVCMLVRWTLIQWEPRERNPYWGRMAAFTVFHVLLVYGVVRFTAGPHPWGTGPLWALLCVPLWATVSFRIHRSFRS